MRLQHKDTWTPIHKDTYHDGKNQCVQLFSAQVLISDYSYSWGDGTELISDTVTVVVVARN